MSEPMLFQSDIPIRRCWFSESSFAHPAKLHLGFLQFLLDAYTQPGDSIGDPMAGVGSILLAATQQRDVIAREIEPKWLALAHENAAEIYRRAGLLAGRMDIAQADARQPWGYVADHLIFSPPYACRASSNKTSRHYVSHKIYRLAKEQGVSYTDRWAKFVEAPSAGSAGAMTFFYGEHPAQMGHFRGAPYWQAMREIYGHAYQALLGGVMALILKDHIRDGQHVQTAQQTIALCEELGFVLVAHHQRKIDRMSLWQRRRKERGEPVIDVEDALVFRKAA